MTTIHVSTNGSNSNSGSSASPLGSIKAGVDAASPGDEVIVHDGVYKFTDQLTLSKDGTTSDRLVIRAADGTTPLLDFQGRGDGIQIYGNNITFAGFEVANSSLKGINPTRADNVVIEDCNVHDCRNWGIMANGGDGVVFRNCDSHHNDGEPENSDGFNMTAGGGQPATNGLIEGCRAWANGDDGYDFWVSQGHVIRDCWAWDNGRGSDGDGNGFKLGGENQGGGHRVERCVAYNNRYRGFDWNTGGDPIEVYNCTSVGNEINYRFRDNGDTLVNNISYDGLVRVGSNTTERNNSWNLGIDDPQFRSTDPTTERFLTLQEDSPCRNAGIDVGLAFVGDSPDLGAFEYGSGSGPTRITVEGDETVLSAADAQTDSSTQVYDNHAGHTGDGYVNFGPDSGTYAEWLLDVDTASEYQVEIRYAHGDDSERKATLFSGSSSTAITFAPTGNWQTWTKMTETVEFTGGESRLRVETTGDDAGNIDQIVLSPSETEEPESGTGSEPADAPGDTPNHGYHTPEAGTADWHTPLNENFELIDRHMPIVDAEAARDQYTANEQTVYIARDTGKLYVGDGEQWNELGTLS